MRFIYTFDDNGLETLAVADAWGAGDNGFTDGDPVLYDATMGVNGNATEVPARWFDDVQRAIKYACREGNGVAGPLANAVSDDPYELAAAVNRAADVYSNTASFVPRGLRFTTNPASLAVTLAAGVFVFEGRKYHATASRLAATAVTGDAVGNGNAFTVEASSDSYVSIGALTDTTLVVRVQAVANDASPPTISDDEVLWAILVSDGTGVVSERYLPSIVIESDDIGNGLEIADTPDGVAAVMPRVSGPHLGSLTTALYPSAVDGGRFFGTVHARGLYLRSGTTSDDFSDGKIAEVNRRTTTIAGATANVNIFSLVPLANSSAIRVEITVIAYSSANQIFSRKIAHVASKTSAGVMSLDGSDVTMSADIDPGATGATVATTLNANIVRASVTGAIGHNFTWFVSAEVYLMGGI
jgi:hypothetical protein